MKSSLKVLADMIAAITRNPDKMHTAPSQVHDAIKRAKARLAD